MELTRELKEDIQLSFHSISAKQGHFGTSTNYIAAEHKVVYRKWGARRRLFHLLPPRKLPLETETLDIPEEITTEDALWDYVQTHKPYWLRGTDRKRRTR